MTYIKCPICQKKGVFFVALSGNGRLFSCRYCHHDYHPDYYRDEYDKKLMGAKT